MADVMLDLETMSTAPNAAIVAIGCVPFDPVAGTVSDNTFYRRVSLQSSVDARLHLDAGTVVWWLKQRDEARRELTAGDGQPLPAALLQLAAWLQEKDDPAELRVWGNGAAFDNVVLAAAYRACGMPVPWRYWNDRCFRTLAAITPLIFYRSGVHHHALQDATDQARHAVSALQLIAAGKPHVTSGAAS